MVFPPIHLILAVVGVLLLVIYFAASPRSKGTVTQTQVNE